MKVLFLIQSAHGHMNPSLAIAKELVRRGERAIFFTIPEFRNAVEAIGAEYQPIPEKFSLGHVVKEHGISMLNDPDKFMKLSLQILQSQKEQAHELLEPLVRVEADLIVYDHMCVWAKELLKSLQIPSVAYFSSFAMTEDSVFMKQRARIVNDEAVMEKIREFFCANDGLNLVMIPKVFQPDSESLGNHFAFVGPQITERPTQPDLGTTLDPDRPIMYISLGSILSNTSFYVTCMEAFADTEWQVIMNVGPGTNIDSLEPTPNNFIIRNFVPQLEVLKQSQVFITHGGMNSTMESLWYEVPPIVIPQSSDQPLVAERVKKLGLGMTLSPSDVSVETLREAVAVAHTEPSIKQNLAQMKKELLAAGGTDRAATLLQEYVKSYK
jgi:UDP:flavonoid glycosyltransferase YjiC (YdhE family)